MKELIDQGKITHWGISEATEEIIRRAHKVLPAYSGTESLFYDVQKLRIIVSGTERTTDWFRGFFLHWQMVFLTCRYDEYSTFEKSTDYRSIMPQFSSAGIVENQKLIEWLKIIAAEKCYPAQISGVDAGKKSVSVPIPGNKKSETSDRKYSGRIHSSVSRRSHRN